MREWPDERETGEGDVYRMDGDELMEHQGWSAETLLVLALAYVQVRGLEDDLLGFLRKRAEEENHVPGA